MPPKLGPRRQRGFPPGTRSLPLPSLGHPPLEPGHLGPEEAQAVWRSGRWHAGGKPWLGQHHSPSGIVQIILARNPGTLPPESTHFEARESQGPG